MSLQKALQNLGITDYAFEGEKPANEAEFLAGFRSVVNGEEITLTAPPAPWVEIEAQMSSIARIEAVEAIKAEAGRRILARYPEWKQRNMTRAGDDEALAAWAWIDGVRTRSDELEAQVAVMDADVLTAFDPTADEHWTG